MKHSKNSFSFYLFILILLLLSVGCCKQASATDVALSYYDLLIKQDSTQVTSLGMTQETAETILNNIHQTLRTQIKENLLPNNPIAITDEQITSIEDAYFKTLQKLNATATSKKKNKSYIVTLSSSYIDFNAINQSATDLALKEVDILKYSNQNTYLTDLTTAYISHLLEGYHNATPSQTTHEAEFVFTKQNGIWLPEDYQTFVNQIYSLISTSSIESSTFSIESSTDLNNSSSPSSATN